ncbi:hypothetical protein [Staphylococcus aureus]|uniref:hypothetical protein n=1 Tax=Staphylococcus aureus TaxID=1280 RepID=UPI0020BEB8F4|nr:hypothetical protein [Staphylococcus aureus]
MNKRQRKKKGLLVEKIKLGSRVIIVKNSMFGHEVGTIGDVVDKTPAGNWTVLAPYIYMNGDVIPLHHPARDLKNIKRKGRRYFL